MYTTALSVVVAYYYRKKMVEYRGKYRKLVNSKVDGLFESFVMGAGSRLAGAALNGFSIGDSGVTVSAPKEEGDADGD